MVTETNVPRKPPWFEDPGELKRVRKKLGLSQSELAMRAGVSREILANIETGRRSLSGDLRHALWAALAKHEMDFKNLVPMSTLLPSPKPLRARQVTAHLSLAEEIAELRARNADLEARAITAEAQVSCLRDQLAEQTIRTQELAERVGELDEIVKEKLRRLHKAIDDDIKKN